MQNSAVMAIRATVLLVCLIAVPVVAICGKNAPEVVKSLIRDYTGTPAKTASTSADSTDAPVFRPGLLGAAAAAPSQESAAAGPVAGGDSLSREQRSGNVSGAPLPLPLAPSGPIAASQAGLAPNGHAGVQTAAVEDRTPNAATFPPDYFRSAEARLRALGATYYLLETVGPAGDQYRFVCKVATGSQPEQMAAFFAVESEALAAMNNVVRQVEGWRSHLNQQVAETQPLAR